MYRLVLLLCLISLAATIALRWWFGSRLLASLGKKPCRCDLEIWMPAPDDPSTIHRAHQSAAELGKQLRDKALAAWRESDPAAAKSRENNRRFGMIAPPFSAIIAIFAVIVGKIPVVAAITIFAAITAIAAVMNLLSIAAELAWITRVATSARQQLAFPNRDDEEAIIACAHAHAWEDNVPAILKWL